MKIIKTAKYKNANCHNYELYTYITNIITKKLEFVFLNKFNRIHENYKIIILINPDINRFKIIQ